jgi:hypothetical protein
VTLRSADLRFALPTLVDTVRVVGNGDDLTALAAGMEAAGIEVLPPATRVRADLVISNHAWALDVPADTHLIVGDRVGRQHGGRPLLVRGGVARPAVIVPLDGSGSLRWHLRHTGALGGPRVRVRNTALSVAAGFEALPHLVPGRALATVVTSAKRPRPPLLLTAARELGLPADVGWVLALGNGDDLQRAVFHVSCGGIRRWAVKFSRVRGHEAPFRRDAEGLTLAQSFPVTAARAPRLLGRLTVSGLPLSVESAAPGHTLAEWLARHSRSRALPLLEELAGWVVDVGVQTAEPAASLEPERTRLAQEVLPAWREAGAPPDLVQMLPDVPGVLAHHDLGTWNILTDGSSITAVDWESARRPAMPLWDLLYLLGDALVRLDGETDRDVLLGHALELFRGEHPRSAVLFGWVGRAAKTQGLPPEAVGPLATLCWMHHGLSAAARERDLVGAEPAPTSHLARLARSWLSDPALGPTWKAWSAWSRSAISP